MSAKELFIEISHHLCSNPAPSTYLQKLITSGELEQYPFPMLTALKKTPQSPIHHPEGNAWNHTCLVVDQAARIKSLSRNPTVFMWAALLHDIGKPQTTKTRRGKITSYDHDKTGMSMAKKFLSAVTDDEQFTEQVSKLVRYHMQLLFVVKNLPFAELEAMQKETDVREVALLGYCDRMGRTNSIHEKELGDVISFLQKCGVDPDSIQLPPST